MIIIRIPHDTVLLANPNADWPGVGTNDYDPDIEPLTFELITGPQRGTLFFHPGGGFRYTPNANFVGPDFFVYKAKDGFGGEAVATVFIEVTNDVPTAVSDEYTAFDMVTLTITDRAEGLLGNDEDPDEQDVPRLRVESYEQPDHGTVTINPDGTFTYDANDGYYGWDSFTYYVTEGLVTSEVGVVNIAVYSLRIRGDLDGEIAGIANDIDLTDTTASTSVGLGVSLIGAVTGPDPHNGEWEYQWSIPGMIVAHFNFDEESSEGATTITDADLKQQSLLYYWIDGAVGREITLTAVGETISLTATAKFDVVRPTCDLTIDALAMFPEVVGGATRGVHFGATNNNPPIHGLEASVESQHEGSFGWIAVRNEYFLFDDDPALGGWYTVEVVSKL